LLAKILGPSINHESPARHRRGKIFRFDPRSDLLACSVKNFLESTRRSPDGSFGHHDFVDRLIDRLHEQKSLRLIIEEFHPGKGRRIHVQADRFAAFGANLVDDAAAHSDAVSAAHNAAFWATALPTRLL
jgi:hypothetical protein